MSSRQQTPDIMGNILAASAPAQPQATMLVLQRITNDGGTQMRAGMDPETIKEYQEAIEPARRGRSRRSSSTTTASATGSPTGSHWVNAAHRSGKYLDIRQTSVRARRDAVLHAAGAKCQPRWRTNADKRRGRDAAARRRVAAVVRR